MPALPGDAYQAAAETLEWQDRRKDTWHGSVTTTHDVHCKSGHQDCVLARQDRNMLRKFWEGKTHGWINAALSRKAAYVEGNASFEKRWPIQVYALHPPRQRRRAHAMGPTGRKTKENSLCRDLRQKSSNLQNSVGRQWQRVARKRASAAAGKRRH